MEGRRDIRVFVSSTFRDLHAERSHLMKQIFPKVRAACRERGIEFTEIDLRWGLTDEDASLGRVIRTCLEEIDHCRPYFLGLLGDRYGWMPPLAEVQKDYQLLNRYPWIEDAVIGGASLVELEFMSGFLNDPAAATGAFVYSRPADGTAEERRKLDSLREKIAASGRPLRNFLTLDEFGELVYQDLLSVLDRDFPSVGSDSPLDIERRLHEVFASTRRKAYIANQTNYQALQDFVTNESGPLVVHGVSGAGKSALMAYFTSYHQRTHPKAFTIAHFVGASPSGSDAQTILRHILGEIKERYAIAEDIPDTKEQLEQLLPTWLARVQDEKLLLVIDAVNQLPEPDNLLGWLPEYVPPNIRLIVTTTPGSSLDNLQKSGWQQLALKPLDNMEREALIVRFLGEYHKGLSSEQLRKIARDPKAASPLFLRTLLEELRLTADYGLLDELIHHYLRSNDLAELFQLVLERMESDYGRDLVVNVLSYIAQSRHGLSESELMELIPPPVKGDAEGNRVHLSILLLALDYHLMKPNGRFTFFHDYLRRAVEKRYLSNPAIARGRHRTLAQYFSTQPISARRIDEEPWHWKEAGETQALLKFLSRLDVLRAFSKRDAEYQLLQEWVATNAEFDNAYDDELEKLKMSSPEAEEYLSGLLAVADFYQTAGRYNRARPLFEELLRRVRPIDGQEETRLKALNALGQISTDRGEYIESEKLLNEALALGESRFGAESPKIVDNLINLASLRYALRNLDQAVALFERALSNCQKPDGIINSKQIEILRSMAAVSYQKGDLDKAQITLEEALDASERVNGDMHSETAEILNSLGAIMIGRKRAAEAMPYIERSVNINRRMMGPNHANTLSSMSNLGAAAYANQDFDLAKRTWQTILPLYSNMHGETSGPCLQIKGNLAMALASLGTFDDAEKLLLEVIETHRQTDGENHSETLIAYLNLAKLYSQSGRYSDARILYDRNLNRFCEVVGENHYGYRTARIEYDQLLAKISVNQHSDAGS